MSCTHVEPEKGQWLPSNSLTVSGHKIFPEVVPALRHIIHCFTSCHTYTHAKKIRTRKPAASKLHIGIASVSQT